MPRCAVNILGDSIFDLLPHVIVAFAVVLQNDFPGVVMLAVARKPILLSAINIYEGKKIVAESRVSMRVKSMTFN